MSTCSCGCSEKEKQKIIESSPKNKIKWLIVSLFFIAPLEIMSLFSLDIDLWARLLFFVVIALIFGRNIIVRGIKSLIKLDFSDINLLMFIAIIGAVFLQKFEEASIIITLFGLGEALEEYGIEKSQSALKELIDKAPKSAQIKGMNEKTPIDRIKIGDIVIIKPGDQIPLDGKIVMGSSLVNEANITGEPLSKNKNADDSVFAGTININGYLEVEVMKTAKDSTLSKIIDLTYESVEKKSRSHKFIEKFAKYYTPTVISISFLLVIIPVWLLNQPFIPWFTQALTLLVISCPCALVISTPITIFSAIGNATKKGVIIKGGRFIEELGKIKAIAFDKTGTLTLGKPIVSDIIPFNGFTKEEVLSCASGMEIFSEHPLSQSIILEAKKLDLEPHKFSNFESVAGKGIKGNCLVCANSHRHMGNLKFISEQFKPEQEIIEQVEKLEKQGKTAIIMTDNEKAIGIIGISDELRKESKTTINKLLDIGVTPIMLTGDNELSARFIAGQIGMKELKAGLLPQDKVTELSNLTNRYKHVAMIGDGVNDAPSLAASSVGIAMGAIGSDIAIENADIALMNNNIANIPYLIKLGKKASQTIRINTEAAIIIKLVFLALALLGKSNLALAIFADVGVTVLVILNGLRLFKFEEKN